MTSLTFSTDPVIIVPANPDRTILLVSNISDTTVYVYPTGELEKFTERARPLKINGTLDISGAGCYKGPIFAMTSAASDIRIFEA